ncbi:MAG: hypothetical protein AAFX81_15970 [Pseudomonadota bacterium]
MIALALGRTVAELRCSLSHRELVDWQRFMGTTPFGPLGDDLRFAKLTAWVAAGAGAPAAALDEAAHRLVARPASPDDDAAAELARYERLAARGAANAAGNVDDGG